MKDKILVVQSCTTKPLFEISLEVIERELEKGNEVDILACNGVLPTCLFSPDKKKANCCKCIYRQEMGRQLLSKKVNVIYLNNCECNVPKSLPTELKSLLTYEENKIHVGKALAAFYTCTHFSSYSNLINENFLLKDYEQYYIWINSFKKIAKNYNTIYIHNGRFPIDKFILDYCKKNNKTVYCYDTADVCSRFVLPKNVPIHDIAYIKDQMNQLWLNSNDSKYEIGKSFFENRRNHVKYGSYNFTKDQTIGKLPSEIDTGKEIITIFNSTAEEVFTVDGFEYKLFNDEKECLETILDHYKDDISKQFILRVHPHLSFSSNYQTKYLYELINKYKNLVLVKPEEYVDSYALMDKSSKVIVLNSTMGIEAAYWGKPVILLGHAYYEDLNCAYFPESLNDLWTLIDSKSLPTLKNDEILKYGFWDLNYGEEYKYCAFKDSISEISFKNTRIDKKRLSIKQIIKKILPIRIIKMLKRIKIKIYSK